MRCATTAAATEADDQLPPIDLLHAVRAHAGKLTVFSQAGEMSLPPSRKVFAFLERCVIPVRAPRHGVVHPKVWVLRYVADGAADQAKARLRVLVASRNLTFDVSWDTIVRLDESTSRTGADLSAVGMLFEQLMSNALGPVDDAHRTRVHGLSEALRRARFALPEGVDALVPHISASSAVLRPCPRMPRGRSSSRRSWAASSSPSWPRSDRRWSSAARRRSTGSAPRRGQRIETMWVFDDGSASDPGIELDDRSPGDPARPLVGLHAKVLAFETERHAHLFLGSANATGQAFRNNVEILLELIGPHDRLGIDALIAAARASADWSRCSCRPADRARGAARRGGA